MNHDPALEAARARRKNLHLAIIETEAAIQAPGRSDQWVDRLAREIDELSAAFEEHAATVEAPDGIIARVVEDAPRLDGLGKRLVEDHTTLRLGLADAKAAIEAIPTDPESDDVDDLREQMMELLSQFTRHRHRGSDFVWEAYDVDIGGPH